MISADLPLGVVVPDGGATRSRSSNARPRRVRSVASSRSPACCAALKGGARTSSGSPPTCTTAPPTTTAPSGHAFTDFDPFWEIVAGPISSGTFGPNALDATFGPEVVFSKVADYPNQSPRGGNQFFGHVAIDRPGQLTVSLRNTAGTVLWKRRLDPQ